MSKKEYELRNVSVHEVDTAGGFFLSGQIYGDGVRFADGHFIYTSKVLDTLEQCDGTRYETMNSYYLVKDL